MPKRLDPADKRDEQVLLRLTSDELDWLESAAHLGRRTVNTYVYRLVQTHVRSLATNAHVLADRRNRHAYDSATAATVDLMRPAVEVDIAETTPQLQGGAK